VPVVLGEALSKDVPIVALHLTRPPITIPDRKALGIAHYFEAAKELISLTILIQLVLSRAQLLSGEQAPLLTS